MNVLSFAAFKLKQRERASMQPWCGSCSDISGERQYLAPHIHYTTNGPETRFHCPECGEEFS